MTRSEQLAVFSLSAIMSLRMVGLFMALPVFSLYALKLVNATPTLIGVAIGIYGLTQALFQIPFGALSDHIGRKPIILAGLFIFIVGSLTCGMAHSIYTVIVGRSLQGVGAVGSATLAMIADLTREEKRTFSMAIVGMTIGVSFAIAMFLGPILVPWIALRGLFFMAALFGMIAIILLMTVTPTPTHSGNPIALFRSKPRRINLKSFFKLIISPELAKLNIGIFILHAVFTASFVIIPINLDHFASLPANEQWKIYLPALIIALPISLFCIRLAEHKHQLKRYFLGSIITLAIAEYLLWIAAKNMIFMTIGLCLFFSGFSLLEAFLPSLISRTAPLARKGSALGLYASAQFLGIFVGGLSGGWLYGQFGFSIVFLFCISLILLWLAIAYFMRAPHYLPTHTTMITPSTTSTSHHPDFIRLKEPLQ